MVLDWKSRTKGRMCKGGLSNVRPDLTIEKKKQKNIWLPDEVFTI